MKVSIRMRQGVRAKMDLYEKKKKRREITTTEQVKVQLKVFKEEPTINRIP